MGDNDSTIKAGIAVVLVLGGLMVYRSMHPSTTFAADGMDPAWDAAVERGHSTGGPTVALFTAGWCGSCQWLHSNVLSRSDIRSELAGHYNFVTVDLTNPPASVQMHAHKLGVSGIPLLIRYDANGKETDRTNGMDPESMMAWLKAGE